MTKLGNKLGKLSLAILENFVEGKLGKKFVDELRRPTKRTLAITKALERTEDRLEKEFEDKALSKRILSGAYESSNSQLREAVGRFYDHPTDPDFPKALHMLISANNQYFTAKRIEKGVTEYIAILTEELIAVDDGFRQNASAIAVVRSERRQRQFLDGLREKSSVLLDSASANFIPGNAPLPPALVIGREHDIKILKHRLVPNAEQQSAGTRLQVLTTIRGWPGVGKTTMAAVLAYDPDIRARYPDGTLWISLGPAPSIISGLAAWGRALGAANVMNEKTVENASNRLSAILRDKHMLLIIDDVWDAAHAVPFQVGGRECATLITTRAHDVAQALATTPDDIYLLNVLSEEKSLELLRNVSPAAVKGYFEDSRELVQELEGLPLAIQVAGHLLNVEMDYGFSVSDLLRDLRNGKKIVRSWIIRQFLPSRCCSRRAQIVWMNSLGTALPI
jgi:hypothetical protein